MKSAYELAMERLGAASPAVKLSADQKARLAEMESVYKAKLAQEDLACRDEVARLDPYADAEKIQERRTLFQEQKRRLEAELEEKKDRIRSESRS
jgi:hypothetical protein